jgi:hypothetical protein
VIVRDPFDAVGQVGPIAVPPRDKGNMHVRWACCFILRIRDPYVRILRQSRRLFGCWPLKGA